MNHDDHSCAANNLEVKVTQITEQKKNKENDQQEDDKTMPMPRGASFDSGYATTANRGGAVYREISEKMTKSGWKMCRSLARATFLTAAEKLAHVLLDMSGKERVDGDAARLARDPEFQEALGDMLEKTLIGDVNRRV